MKALWKGRIQFGPVDIPVKLYSAVADFAVHSRLLHDQDRVPLVQKMVCPEDGKVVSTDETVKGYEVKTGEFVITEPDDLDFMEPEGSRQINVMRFVKSDEIDERYLDRTYYLGPDNDNQVYINFAESLKETKLAGICQWVMRKRSYVGVLKFSDEVITLTTHRYASEIEPEDSFKLEQAKISEKEMKIADRLVSGLEEKFAPGMYKDQYQSKLQKLIDEKAKGKKVKLPSMTKIKETESEQLLNALEESLKSLKKK